MPDLEAIGDAVTGGVVGRAIEPRAGEAVDGHTAERNCLNCGCALSGDYCHCCGQQAHVHRTLGAFWHDLLHGVLHFEGKIWRTLPMLALHPGQLTRRYVHGERAKFVSPLALFLFSAFLMFAVFSLLGAPTDLTSDTPDEDRAEAMRDIATERDETARKLADLQQELRHARAAKQPTQSIEAEMEDVRRELAIEEQGHRLALRLAGQEEERARGQANQAASETGKDDAQPREGEREREINVIGTTGWPTLDRAVEKAEKNPSLLFYKIQNNAYKFSWALIPISLPFLWVLFLHRRRYRRDYGAYDHLIFLTYSIAFMSMAAIVLALLRPLGAGDAIIGSAIAFIPPIHIYRQLRGAYDLSRWSAAWRTFVLLVFSSVALTLFLLLLVVLGVLG
jgi:hypothetical protein